MMIPHAHTETVLEAAAHAASPSSGYKPVTDKYGEAAFGGFQAVPDLLLKHQADLKLTATDLVVLLNVLMHWWYADQKPFPRATTISKRMGVTPRTVQRSIHSMQKNGILNREVLSSGPIYLDPTPLVVKLEALAVNDKDYLSRRKRNTA